MFCAVELKYGGGVMGCFRDNEPGIKIEDGTIPEFVAMEDLPELGDEW